MGTGTAHISVVACLLVYYTSTHSRRVFGPTAEQKFANKLQRLVAFSIIYNKLPFCWDAKANNNGPISYTMMLFRVCDTEYSYCGWSKPSWCTRTSAPPHVISLLDGHSPIYLLPYISLVWTVHDCTPYVYHDTSTICLDAFRFGCVNYIVSLPDLPAMIIMMMTACAYSILYMNAWCSVNSNTITTYGHSEGPVYVLCARVVAVICWQLMRLFACIHEASSDPNWKYNEHYKFDK